jgi:hypothetical protein
MGVTPKPLIYAELAKHGHNAMLVNEDGYFCFGGGEAADRLDKTVAVPNSAT